MNTDFFCVARSGPTVDGRVITPQDIADIAETYNPATYGARVWLEHFRTVYPDGTFMAYGDVVALRAQPGPDGTVELHASICPTPELLAIKQARQKVYWSIEFTPNFAATGRAYLTGLAVTDSPASLGTEAWKFSNRSQETTMSTPLPEPVEPAQVQPAVPGAIQQTDDSFMTKFKALFSAENGKTSAALEQHEQAMSLLAERLNTVSKDTAQAAAACAALTDQVTALAAKLDAALTDPTPVTPAPPAVAGQPFHQEVDY